MIFFKKNANLGGMLLIFFTFLETVSGNLKKTPEVTCEPVIRVSTGEDVIFQCWVTPDRSAIKKTLEWTRPDLRQDSEKKYVLVYRSQDVDKNLIMEMYKGRASLYLDQPQNGNVSLKITNVTVNDRGLYEILIPSLNISAVIKLLVSDGKDNTSKSQNGTNMKPKVEPHWWVVVYSAPYVAGVVVVVAVAIAGFYLCNKCKKKKRSLNKLTGQNSGEDETSIPLQEVFINSQ